jgi:hypothetical protein
MWFVQAKRNQTRVLLPAYAGKREAENMMKSLKGFGWEAKLREVDGSK